MSYKKRNWSKYNRTLVNRGSLTLWIDPKALKQWKAKRKKKPGKPFKYSELAIQTAATIRYTFKLSLRATEGFLNSLTQLLKLEADVPSYSQVCKRMQKMNLASHFQKEQAVRHLVLDTTGLKVFGEGEWKVKKHGTGYRRRWRKLHLAIDEHTQELVFAKLSTEYVSDTRFIDEIVKSSKKLKRLTMDGAADSSKIYRLLDKQGINLLTPPQSNAVLRKEPWLKKRNERILQILGLGGDKLARTLWAKLCGYSKRATVESAIARWKKLFGASLQSRVAKNQDFETSIKSLIMNKMKKLEFLT